MQNRVISLLIAALLPLLLFQWFLPSVQGQIDVWLIWLVAMLIIGLPLMYAEVGLALRSNQIPAKGLQELTRQADASTIWRGFAWLTACMALVIVALIIDASSVAFLNAIEHFGVNFNVPVFAIAAVLAVISGMLSLLGKRSLIAGLTLIIIAFLIGVIAKISASSILTGLSITQLSLSEWSKVVVLALVGVGSASGLYWFSTSALNQGDDTSLATTGKKVAASRLVLPIWLTQLVVGSVVILLYSKTQSALASLVYTLGVVVSGAFLTHYASSQIATKFAKFGIWIATLICIAILVLLVIIASPTVLSTLLVVITLISSLCLAIFSGWKMKISHMRKSLNFSSEGIYNLWRVAIRILVPLLVVVAIIGRFL